MVEYFFENLAYRKRNENDLSDVTWALCMASHSFQTLFLNFFFSSVEFSDITMFEREKSEGDSRPDFLIENSGLIYLIECKINDRNHHFEQYTSTFGIPNERLGYITNYKMFKDGFIVKTWEEFYDLIQYNLPEDEDEKGLWEGYSKYLKSVCNIIKITKKMNLKGMYSLYSFVEIIKKLVERNEDEYELNYYSNKNIFGGVGVSGCYFGIKFSNTNIDPTWAWIGVFYEREEPLICMGFEKKEDWCKPVFDIIDKYKLTIDKGEFATKPYWEGSTYWFELNKEKHKEFDDSDLDNQILILKSFVDEVLSIPINILKTI